MFNSVGPDYFKTLRITMLAGREFEDGRRCLGAEGGHRQRNDGATVLGESGRRHRQAHREPPVNGAPSSAWRATSSTPRLNGDAAALRLPGGSAELRIGDGHPRAEPRRRHRVLDRLQRPRPRDGSRPADFLARMLAEQARGDLGNYEMAARTLVMFGAMTIALSALGIYGLVAYTVRQRTQEIGIRLAVGATVPTWSRASLAAVSAWRRSASARSRRGNRHHRVTRQRDRQRRDHRRHVVHRRDGGGHGSGAGRVVRPVMAGVADRSALGSPAPDGLLVQAPESDIEILRDSAPRARVAVAAAFFAYVVLIRPPTSPTRS